ncbi:hypothetical protein E5288_WYG010391 [Bos mutus]|uniref:Uncharacterized protein n=1 Tax=Bos mutus TaxID=72004 RepID=A0A6B0RVN8_9CETA|nr:hypothetical protein [Bos mutus]
MKHIRALITADVPVHSSKTDWMHHEPPNRPACVSHLRLLLTFVSGPGKRQLSGCSVSFAYLEVLTLGDCIPGPAEPVSGLGDKRVPTPTAPGTQHLELLKGCGGASAGLSSPTGDLDGEYPRLADVGAESVPRRSEKTDHEGEPKRPEERQAGEKRVICWPPWFQKLVASFSCNAAMGVGVGAAGCGVIPSCRESTKDVTETPYCDSSVHLLIDSADVDWLSMLSTVTVYCIYITEGSVLVLFLNTKSCSKEELKCLPPVTDSFISL